MNNKRNYILGMILLFLVGAVAGAGTLYWLQTAGVITISSGEAKWSEYPTVCRSQYGTWRWGGSEGNCTASGGTYFCRWDDNGDNFRCEPLEWKRFDGTVCKGKVCAD